MCSETSLHKYPDLDQFKTYSKHQLPLFGQKIIWDHSVILVELKSIKSRDLLIDLFI